MMTEQYGLGRNGQNFGATTKQFYIVQVVF